MACNCIELYDEALKEKGVEITRTLVAGMKDGHMQITVLPGVKIVLNKFKKSRKAAPNLMAIYCPFCGKKYEEDENAILSPPDRI